ncbi:hypothetical protein [Streptomyces sp. NPDC059564]
MTAPRPAAAAITPDGLRAEDRFPLLKFRRHLSWAEVDLLEHFGVEVRTA